MDIREVKMRKRRVEGKKYWKEGKEEVRWWRGVKKGNAGGEKEMLEGMWLRCNEGEKERQERDRMGVCALDKYLFG